MIDWSDIFEYVAVVDTRATSNSGFNRVGEVEGVDEGVLLS